MKITKKRLAKEEACSEGVEWFKRGGFKTDKEVFKGLFKDNQVEWANWTVVRLLNRKQKIQYAVYAAKQVLHIFEKECPNDKRPRNAINAAIKCINNNTAKNRDAAWVAWAAARDAAGAAGDAMKKKIVCYGIKLAKLK